MARNLETRLAKLEAAQGPAAVTHMLFAQTDAEADAQITERIAEGTAKESDHFIVVRWIEGIRTHLGNSANQASLTKCRG